MLRLCQLAVLFAVTVSFVGCNDRADFYAKQPAPVHPYTLVKAGMTEAEVIAILGEPTKRGKMIVYPNDPIKTQDKQQIIYWETDKLGNIQIEFKLGKVHSKLKK